MSLMDVLDRMATVMPMAYATQTPENANVILCGLVLTVVLQTVWVIHLVQVMVAVMLLQFLVAVIVKQIGREKRAMYGVFMVKIMEMLLVVFVSHVIMGLAAINFVRIMVVAKIKNVFVILLWDIKGTYVKDQVALDGLKTVADMDHVI